MSNHPHVRTLLSNLAITALIYQYQFCYCGRRMTGHQLIRQARVSAGLTQRELARRLGTHQPVISRWESESTRPDFESVVTAVEACGFDLIIELRSVDHDTVLVKRELAKSPSESLTGLVDAVSAFNAMSAAVHD